MVALVALAGIGAFAGSASAATTTLAGDGTDTVTGFTADSSNDLETSIASDGTDFDTDGTETLKMNVSYDGETYALTSEDVTDGTTASQTVNLSNDKLSDLPGDAGQITTVSVTTWGVDGSGTVTTAESSFQVDITFDNSYAVTNVDDSSATIEDVDASGWNTFSFGLLGDDDPADRHTYERTVGVDGSNTTVTLNDETTNGSSAFSDAMDDKDSGDLIHGASTGVNGTPVLAFYQSADSDIVDTSTDTYAVYDANGNGEWTFELGDDYSDATSVDLYVSSQSFTSVDSFEQADLNSLFIDKADMGLYSLGSNFGWTSLGSFSLLEAIGIGMTAPAGGLSLAFLIPAGRRRLGGA
ncbi:hypothetical protein FGF80_18435 (plasmid) [Natrinema pallidum]|uniref:Uncharacterized protein n=2 Tax=Natrinema pallidum TaxID=69527 RepID=A0A4P9TK14_9EURY|nr:hypothetical protein FGF80_18435 [Natrinema pallidum]